MAGWVDRGLPYCRSVGNVCIEYLASEYYGPLMSRLIGPSCFQANAQTAAGLLQ